MTTGARACAGGKGAKKNTCGTGRKGFGYYCPTTGGGPCGGASAAGYTVGLSSVILDPGSCPPISNAPFCSCTSTPSSQPDVGIGNIVGNCKGLSNFGVCLFGYDSCGSGAFNSVFLDAVSRGGQQYWQITINLSDSPHSDNWKIIYLMAVSSTATDSPVGTYTLDAISTLGATCYGASISATLVVSP